MAKKLYYTEQEAADLLGIDLEELARRVRDDKLRIFQDGAKKMFKADEVDAMAGGGAPREVEEIELAPVDSVADRVSLSEADAAAEEPPGKEDTVITAEGISIFDDEDLEIEVADPMAKTQIAPSLADQMSLEGVTSGSGLLDLTRESDDTSLGAEVLDHIDMEEGLGSSITDVPDTAPGTGYGVEPVAAPVQVVAAPAPIEQVDAASGLFGGVVVGCALVFAVLGAVVLAAAQNIVPDYLTLMKQDLKIVLGGAAVVIVLCAVIGFAVGKAAAARQQATARMGG